VVVELVRVQWLDYTSVTRYRAIPAASFLKLMRSARPSVGIAKCTLGMVELTVADEFNGFGEYLLRIDASTLRLFPSEPGVAVVNGFIEEKAARKDGGVQVDLCPRTILKRVTE
jgi:glutamine synthetase